MRLAHNDTIAVEPIKTESVLGIDDLSNPVSGRGIVKLVGDLVQGIKTGDTVYYNTVMGSYISHLNLVVVGQNNVYIIGDAE